MRFSLRETKIELFTKCHFLTSDKVFALHDAGPLRVKIQGKSYWEVFKRSLYYPSIALSYFIWESL